MSELEELEKRIRNLPPAELAKFREWFAHFDRSQQAAVAEIEKAWDHEIRQRMAAYDRGEAQPISAEAVFAEARRLAK